MKKFFAVIGNPPYQETVAKVETKNGQKAVKTSFRHFKQKLIKFQITRS